MQNFWMSFDRRKLNLGFFQSAGDSSGPISRQTVFSQDFLGVIYVKSGLHFPRIGSDFSLDEIKLGPYTSHSVHFSV